MLKNVLSVAIAALALVVSFSVHAEEEEVTVILPLEAQTCDLPSAPSTIPEDADYDRLVKAKGQVADFQAAMVSYRACLDEAREVEGLTDGNLIALNQAHNYSVEMEERIAEQFNEAVRAYKARQAAAKQD